MISSKNKKKNTSIELKSVKKEEKNLVYDFVVNKNKNINKKNQEKKHTDNQEKINKDKKNNKDKEVVDKNSEKNKDIRKNSHKEEILTENKEMKKENENRTDIEEKDSHKKNPKQKKEYIEQKKSKNSLYIHAAIIVSFVIFALCIGALSLFAYHEKRLSDKIYPNVFIDGIYVGEITKEEASKKFKRDGEELRALKFNIFYKNDQIATVSSELMAIRWDKEEIIDQAYNIGRSPHTPSKIKHKILSVLKLEKYEFETKYIYDKAPVEEFIDDLSSQYEKPPKNALFTLENGKVVAFKPDEKGLAIDKEGFFKNIEKILEDMNKSKKIKNKSVKIEIKDKIIDPEITLAKSNDLGIDELIGEGASDYSGSIPSRVHNLTLATSKFHGVIIKKGEIISFNKIIGDISVNTGYKQAYIIQNGKTVLGDGGGVCQISTTLFRAGLNTGLPILERHAHAYRVGYYENDSDPGFDATIYSPSVDLRMKNDTPSNILIQTEIDEEKNIVYFRLYGKKDGRESHLSPATVYDITEPPPDKHEEDPNLPVGTVKQVDFSAWGAKVKFDYKVTREGENIYEETFFSNYKPWAAVYMVGTKQP